MQKYLERRGDQHPQDQNPTVGAKLKFCFWKFLKMRSLKEREKIFKSKQKIVRPQKQNNRKKTIIQSKTKPSIL